MQLRFPLFYESVRHAYENKQLLCDDVSNPIVVDCVVPQLCAVKHSEVSESSRYICKGEDQEMETKMRNRADRVVVSVILVCILALFGTFVGVTWILAAHGPGGNQQALASQGTPVLG